MRDAQTNQLHYVMPRTRYPHLPHKDRLYEGLRPPQSKKTLLTVNQINQFYDNQNNVHQTRNRLWKAKVEPVAFGPRNGRGQSPMLFKAGDVQRALERLDAPYRRAYQPTGPDIAPDKVFAKQPVSAAYEVKRPLFNWSDLDTAPPEDARASLTPSAQQDEPIPAAETLASVASEIAVEEEMESPTGQGLPPDAVEITFNAIVDDESCDELMQKIHEAVNGGAKDIILWISSEGGSLFAALGVYDRLRYLQRVQEVRLHTVATGYVLSAGMILLAAGERRYALPHAIFMLHEPYQMPWETGEDAKVLVTEIQERGELHKLSIEKIAHIFYERDPRPEKDAESWKDFFKVPAKRYFGAEEAWQWGLVEEQL